MTSVGQNLENALNTDIGSGKTLGDLLNEIHSTMVSVQVTTVTSLDRKFQGLHVMAIRTNSWFKIQKVFLEAGLSVIFSSSSLTLVDWLLQN